MILKDAEGFSLRMDEVDHIFIVTNEEYMDRCQEIWCEITDLDKVEGIVRGGAERQESVYNALQEVNAHLPWAWPMC